MPTKYWFAMKIKLDNLYRICKNAFKRWTFKTTFSLTMLMRSFFNFRNNVRCYFFRNTVPLISAATYIAILGRRVQWYERENTASIQLPIVYKHKWPSENNLYVSCVHLYIPNLFFLTIRIFFGVILNYCFLFWSCCLHPVVVLTAILGRRVQWYERENTASIQLPIVYKQKWPSEKS